MNRIETSPSGRYTLTITSVETKPGCWNYTIGTVAKAPMKPRPLEPGEMVSMPVRDLVADVDLAVALSTTPGSLLGKAALDAAIQRSMDGYEICKIERNYSSFPFLWVEGHSSGHDYLVAGADYQGQTVIELDTGLRRDHLPPEAEQGHGFCWVDYHYEASQQMLVVAGCIWACPYEYRFYDFADPMNGWPAIECDDGYIADDGKQPTFEADGTIVCYETASDSDADGDEARRVVATGTFRRDGLKLVKLSEWVDPEEQKRRDAHAARQQAWAEAWALYTKTDPLFLLVAAWVEEHDEVPYGLSTGVTFAGWCPHFTGEDARICRRLVQRSDFAGDQKVSIDLEWGRTVAPIKLIHYVDGKLAATTWFKRSTDGMKAALDAASVMA